MTTPRSILLTVATGSLGSHILAALLDRTGATVYCLVRADGAAEARDRLGRRLESLGEPGLPGGPRLIAVAADLERPAFGLDSERYDALAESVDAIIHCAANVDLSGDYERLVPANVDATKSVIALSRRRATLAGRPAEIHHVSTMAVPDLFEALRRAGHRLDPVPSQEWWRRAEERRDDPLLQPLLGMRAIAAFVVSDGSASQVPLVRSDATWSALSDLGLRPGPFGAEFLDRLVAQLPLPAPRRVPAGAGPPPVRIDALAHPLLFHHEDYFPDAAGSATAAEQAGYGMFWTAEERYDALTAVAAAVPATALPLGTAAVLALTRSPLPVAHAAHDLQAASRGRFILGLASQIPFPLKYSAH